MVYFMGDESAETGVEMSSFEKKPVRIKKVEMLPTEKIKPHEEVDSEEMKSFKESLKEKRIFYKPILVAKIDEDEYMIVDGTHRWAGLKDMGADEIPSIVLDYHDENEVKLYSWYPLTDSPLEKVLEILKDTNAEIEKLNRDKALDRIGECEFILTDNKESYLVSGNHRDIFMNLIDSGVIFSYADEKEKALEMVDEEGKTGLIRRTPDKKEVLETVANGDYMPPKGTRHWLPYKYPHIYYEVEDLV